MTFQDEIKQVAEGKLACACGNQDWRQFLFVSLGASYRAACKRCFSIWIYENKIWRREP